MDSGFLAWGRSRIPASGLARIPAFGHAPAERFCIVRYLAVRYVCFKRLKASIRDSVGGAASRS